MVVSGQTSLLNYRAIAKRSQVKYKRLRSLKPALLYKGAYSLDHFLPWRYVAHDLLWNILPASKSVNSSKSDSLPHLPRYSKTMFCC
ncbi:MAG: HNH endonuclease domain-containing protein [Anaerolineales bacterium]